ncbi:MAG: hypothetical protein ACKVP0_27910 [Pirellulaceae bacterium]
MSHDLRTCWSPVVRSLRERNLRCRVATRLSARGASGPHSGMTILEVLFAIMITTIGLLGAISVFPVASEMARKGRLNDEVAICADTAVHKFDAQAMRRPDRWVRYVVLNPATEAYRLDTAQNLLDFAAPSESYCIDPKLYAQNLKPATAMGPYNFNNPNPIPSDPQVTRFPTFAPFVLTGAAAAGPPRMARLTLWNNNVFSPSPMGRFQADFTFGFEDQLVYERSGVQQGAGGGADNSLPAFQIYSPIQNNGGILPGKREEEGKLSWMATLVPKFDQFTGATDDKYVLSTVIFNKRSPNLVVGAPLVHEKSAIILGQSASKPNPDFHGSGYGGGEVTITSNTVSVLDMRAGDWVMLAGFIRGPVDNGSSNMQKPFLLRRMFKWYRISEADEDPYEQVIGSGIWKRDVTLVGPDWDLANVLPCYVDSGSGNVVSDFVPDNFADDVEVIIIPNVVAVYERTVRLERDGNGF